MFLFAKKKNFVARNLFLQFILVSSPLVQFNAWYKSYELNHAMLC